MTVLYINGLEQDSENRIVQLINMYDKGEQLEFSDIKQKELLLILFSWCLSSSNRWFRDVTSKAMIEILKEDFSLCEYLLTTVTAFADAPSSGHPEIPHPYRFRFLLHYPCLVRRILTPATVHPVPCRWL